MPIVRWDPFRELFQTRDEIGRWFGDLSEREKDEKRSAVWAPSVDIKETETEVTVRADLPGIKMEDIDVSVDENQLIIKGERKFEKEEKEKDYIRVERSYGSFYRSFDIGVPIKSEEVKANYADGVLDITIPKAEVKKPKKVEIAVSKKENK
ncbi:MAG: Hsp20/alpha crystallin family protein [Actinobacteria bacterium]|nr:Hsp20/alpha crystallin family protein [Actinomycetota bacterium]